MNSLSGTDIVSRFESSGRIKGRYEKSVPIGAVFRVKKEKTELNASVASIRPADATCAAEDGSFWLLMAQSELAFSVVGELQAYFNLYREEHTHDKPPRMGIVCEKINDQVAWLCSKLGIDVFQLSDQSAERIEARLLR